MVKSKLMKRKTRSTRITLTDTNNWGAGSCDLVDRFFDPNLALKNQEVRDFVSQRKERASTKFFEALSYLATCPWDKSHLNQLIQAGVCAGDRLYDRLAIFYINHEIGGSFP